VQTQRKPCPSWPTIHPFSKTEATSVAAPPLRASVPARTASSRRPARGRTRRGRRPTPARSRGSSPPAPRRLVPRQEARARAGRAGSARRDPIEPPAAASAAGQCRGCSPPRRLDAVHHFEADPPSIRRGPGNSPLRQGRSRPAVRRRLRGGNFVRWWNPPTVAGIWFSRPPLRRPRFLLRDDIGVVVAVLLMAGSLWAGTKERTVNGPCLRKPTTGSVWAQEYGCVAFATHRVNPHASSERNLRYAAGGVFVVTLASLPMRRIGPAARPSTATLQPPPPRRRSQARSGRPRLVKAPERWLAASSGEYFSTNQKAPCCSTTRS